MDEQYKHGDVEAYKVDRLLNDRNEAHQVYSRHSLWIKRLRLRVFNKHGLGSSKHR